jgi:hypothetical protein
MLPLFLVLMAQAAAGARTPAHKCACAVDGKHLSELEAAYSHLVDISLEKEHHVEKAKGKSHGHSGKSESRDHMRIESANQKAKDAEQKAHELLSALHEKDTVLHQKDAALHQKEMEVAKLTGETHSHASLEHQLQNHTRTLERELQDTTHLLAQQRAAYAQKLTELRAVQHAMEQACTCEASLLKDVDGVLSLPSQQQAGGAAAGLHAAATIGIVALGISLGMVRSRPQSRCAAHTAPPGVRVDLHSIRAGPPRPPCGTACAARLRISPHVGAARSQSRSKAPSSCSKPMSSTTTRGASIARWIWNAAHANGTRLATPVR